MNINEKSPFGVIYDLSIVADDLLKNAIEEILGHRVAMRDVKIGRYAKEALEAVKRWGHQIVSRKQTRKNLVPNFLRYELAKVFIGESVAPTFNANYIALGDDATAPAYTNTTLGNETYRSLFDARYTSFNVAYFDKFFGSSVVGGNSYREVGIFTDATASANSGYLLSHSGINEDMEVNESLTVNGRLTFTDS